MGTISRDRMGSRRKKCLPGKLLVSRHHALASGFFCRAKANLQGAESRYFCALTLSRWSYAGIRPRDLEFERLVYRSIPGKLTATSSSATIFGFAIAMIMTGRTSKRSFLFESLRYRAMSLVTWRQCAIFSTPYSSAVIEITRKRNVTFNLAWGRCRP